MKSTREPGAIAPYLSDESRMKGGAADEVLWPETAAEAAEVLRCCSASGRPVTVSGAGTGIAGGRVPLGGVVLATDRFNRILDVRRDPEGGGAVTVQAGVTLAALQQALLPERLWYPPDPTETGAWIGGTLATNASGARTFRFGPTRRWVERIVVALPTGELLDLARGRVVARDGSLEIALGTSTLRVPAPDWTPPATSKHAAGYFSAPGMDLVDLFVGCEGTLGVILEADLRLVPAPDEVLSGILFFSEEPAALAFVAAAREGEAGVRPLALEFADARALALVRESAFDVPRGACAAIFFEDAVRSAEAAARLDAWLELAERRAASPESWFAQGPSDHQRFREFRHRIPTAINELIARRGVTKVSTDTAVPRGRVGEMLAAFRREIDGAGFESAAHGHVGDDHLHVNVLPPDPGRYAAARDVYGKLVRIAVEMGGTTSAEHGLGKLKAGDLRLLYPPPVLARMRAIKDALDPANVLGRGTLFPQDRGA
ncbi:MAG: FAD-binding oxidoreductase [Acidobacteria bacterium]|nr:FAD-binding oxidoreductase [Acidobacteriota bacterium]